MTKHPRFYLRYRNTTDAGLSWEALSEYLDRLDSAEWLELLSDLVVTQSTAVHEVFAPPPSSSLLAYAAQLLRQCSAITLSHCAGAVERVIAQQGSAVIDGAPLEPILRALRLMEMLGSVVPPHAAAMLVLNPQVPEPVRALASIVVSHRETHLVWHEVDLRNEPFLLPAVVVALTRSSPSSALHVLVTADFQPPDLVTLSYPLRIALRRLCHHEQEGGLARAAELLSLMPDWHWSRDYVWNETLQLKEFSRLRERLGVDDDDGFAGIVSDRDFEVVGRELAEDLQRGVKNWEQVRDQFEPDELTDPDTIRAAIEFLREFAAVGGESDDNWRGDD